jgi:threonine synthase
MRWSSTRGKAPQLTFRDALFAGLAPDGGLYLPEHLEPLPETLIESLRGRSVADVGAAIAEHLIGDEIPRDALEHLISEALNFEIPLVPVASAHALELFHGPTFAFKDVGARVMARLMAHFVSPGDLLTVLVATSGDTGSAVAQAFFGVAGTRVVVLYPHGQVSDVQEAQFATLGGNVQAVAVDGTFDDCQALVKEAFSDAHLRDEARLTSANSINVGRLLPQTFYYGWASLAIAGAEAPALRAQALQPSPTISVPSGNFGNLTAGLIAKRLGFPIGRFIAATNVNDVVPQYLLSGRYEPRASVRTVANAMDVGAPSNFERMLALYDRDLDRMRADVEGAAFDDVQVTATIADVHSQYGYTLDPHSAIAWLGLGNQPGIFVATAHPAKFRETVEPAIGHAVDLPAALREAMTRPRLITRMRPQLSALRDVIGRP